MLLDVIKRVLAHVRDPEIVMDEEATIGRIARLGVPHDHLHERRLPGAVGPDQAHAGAERHLQVDVRQRVPIAPGIAVVDPLHFQEALRRRAYALEAAGIREYELQVGRGQLEVVLRLGLLLDEGGHFPGVVHELAVGSPHRALLVVDHCRRGAGGGGGGRRKGGGGVSDERETGRGPRMVGVANNAQTCRALARVPPPTLRVSTDIEASPQ